MNNNNDVTNYILSGSGCSNIFELRLAYDALRNYMYCKYNDSWDARRVAELVSKEIYAQTCCGNNCQDCPDKSKCKKYCEGAD